MKTFIKVDENNYLDDILNTFSSLHFYLPSSLDIYQPFSALFGKSAKEGKNFSKVMHFLQTFKEVQNIY